jgi:hypothetical protein
LTATTDATLTDTQTLINRRFDTQSLIDAAAAGSLALDGVLPTLADNGFETANNRTVRSSSQITLNGNPLLLPAGEVSTTLDIGFDWLQIESDDTRTLVDTKLSRSRWEAGANVAVPIAERGGAWGGIGGLTLNLNGGLEELSDFGTLIDASAGATWEIADNLDLTATYIYAEVAPSLSELGRPQITTFNATVFDFVNGESVLATVTSGGNSNLVAETQRDWKFAANWELPMIDNTRFTAEYIRNRSSDVTSSFPAITEAIEAAFPDRITRDVTGRLTDIDRRPVTFARTRSERLVFGLNTRGSFGEASAQASSGRGEGSGRGGPPGMGRPGGGQESDPQSDARQAEFSALRERICAVDGGTFLLDLARAVAADEDLSNRFAEFDGERARRMVAPFQNEDGSINEDRLGGFRERICSSDGGEARPAEGAQGSRASRMATRGFGRDGRGRYFVNLTHSIELENTIQIGQATPVLDQLDGDTTQALGFPSHNTRLEAGIFRNGKGLRLSGTYTGSTRINGSTQPGSSDLFFDDLVIIDLRVFFNLGQVFEKRDTFLKNIRVAFRADNVFNSRRNVRNASGDVPLTYQPNLLDPTGRFVGIDIRKMF